MEIRNCGITFFIVQTMKDFFLGSELSTVPRQCIIFHSAFQFQNLHPEGRRTVFILIDSFISKTNSQLLKDIIRKIACI